MKQSGYVYFLGHRDTHGGLHRYFDNPILVKLIIKKVLLSLYYVRTAELWFGSITR